MTHDHHRHHVGARPHLESILSGMLGEIEGTAAQLREEMGL